MSKYNYINNDKENNILFGSSQNINAKEKCDSEIRVDVVVSKYENISIWGQVRDYCDQPVSNIMVKLMKISNDGNKEGYKEIAYLVSDLEGFYRFNLCIENERKNDFYKIIVCSNNKVMSKNNTPFVSSNFKDNICKTEVYNCEQCNLVLSCSCHTQGSKENINTENIDMYQQKYSPYICEQCKNN